MAERYASQRSSKPIRRRTLPRLSDTATALEERSAAESADDDAGMSAAYGGAGTATFTAGAAPRATSGGLPRATNGALPRRPATPGRRAGAISTIPTAIRVDYSYVRRDLRRIAITAVSMLILLIVLNIIVQHIIG